MLFCNVSQVIHPLGKGNKAVLSGADIMRIPTNIFMWQPLLERSEAEEISFFMVSNAGMTDYMSPAFLLLLSG